MEKTKAELLQEGLAKEFPGISVAMWRPDPKGDVLYTFTNENSNALCITLDNRLSLKNVVYQRNRYSNEKGVTATREMLPDELKAVYDSVYNRSTAKEPAREPVKQYKTEPSEGYGFNNGKEYEYEY